MNRCIDDKFILINDESKSPARVFCSSAAPPFDGKHSSLHKHAAGYLHHDRGLLVDLVSMQCRRLCSFADLFVCFRTVVAYPKFW